jgi:hypothetical protein
VDVASLSLRVDTSDLTDAQRELRRLGNQGGQTEGQVTRFGGAAQRSFGVVAAAATAALISVVSLGAGFSKFVANTITADSAQAQLAAAISSTGGAADRTLEQLNQHAAALQKITNVGDEATSAMQGVLLTFTQIQGSVFDRATAAVLDLSTAMGTGLNAAALQVGKALNDPVLGMTALSRSGIQFTQAQKDVVAAMVETNNVAGAQEIILNELEKQFGGSAAAARGTLGGALESLGNAFGDLFEIAGDGSNSLRNAVESLIKTISEPSFVAAIQGIGVAMFGMAEVAIRALSAISSALTVANDFVGDFRGYAIAAALALTVAYTPAIIAATVATSAWVAALITVRGALIATGIGALIVGAGLLINQFLLLVEGAGGFGIALGLLKDVALGIWGKIKAGADVMQYGIALAFNDIGYAFTEELASMAQKWAKFVDDIAASSLGGMIGIEGGNSTRIGDQYSSLLDQSTDEFVQITASLKAAQAALASPTEGMEALRAAMADANSETSDSVANTKALAAALEKITKEIDGSGGASSAVEGLAKSLDDAATASDGFADTFRDGISSAFDYVLGGMKNGMDGLLDIFKRTLIDMVKFAIMNPINLQGGMSIAGMGSAALSGGGGMLGGLGAGLGAIGAGLTSGASVAINGIMAGGGLGPTLGAVTGGIGAGGLSGFATAIGAAAVPLLAVAAVFSFFKSKTKLIDSGIQATIGMEEAMFESFREIEKSRFFGLSKKRSTSTSALSAEEAGPLNEAVFLVRESVIGAAESLGVSSDIFDGFTHKFTLSLKGLDEAAQAAAITEEFARMGDSLAGLVPHIETMNQLFAVAANRVSLTDRLLQAQGETEELTARIRAREMDATNELNKALLAQVFAAEDAAAAINRLTASFSENAFATGVDFRRGMARASNGIEYSPQQSQAEMLAELKGLNARMDLLQSTSEITANSSSQTAENTDYSNALTLDAQT